MPGGGGEAVGTLNGNVLTWTVPEQNADLISAGVLINNINTFGLHLPLNIGNPPRPDQGFLSRGRASFSSPVPFKTGTTFFSKMWTTVKPLIIVFMTAPAVKWMRVISIF